MEKRYYSEYSQCLDRNMDFIVYGHSGVLRKAPSLGYGF